MPEKKEENAQVAAAPAPRKKSMAKIVLVAALALVLAGGGVAGGLILLRGKSSESASEPEPTPEPSQTFRSFGEIYEINPPFTVNLSDSSGRRYLKLSVGLELAEGVLAQDIDKRLPLIRDALVILLSGKKLEDISTAEGKEQLKQEILLRVEQFLGPDAVNNVLFTEFLVQ